MFILKSSPELCSFWKHSRMISEHKREKEKDKKKKHRDTSCPDVREQDEVGF